MILLIQEKGKVIPSSFSKAKGEREGGASSLHPSVFQQDLAPQASALKLANEPLTWRMGAFQGAASDLDSGAGEPHTASPVSSSGSPVSFHSPHGFLAFPSCLWGSWGNKPGVLEFMGHRVRRSLVAEQQWPSGAGAQLVFKSRCLRGSSRRRWS